jgi:hypothetical protein
MNSFRGPPTVKDVTEETTWWWVKGDNFHKPIVVRCNKGVRQTGEKKPKAVADLNFEFGYPHPPFLWRSDLVTRWHPIAAKDTLWIGPIKPPKDFR